MDARTLPSRRAPRARRIATALVATLVAAGGLGLLAGCGKKGPPMPPLRTIPIAITDLTLRQQGSLMMLDMAYPATTSAGMALGGIDAVELWVLAKPLAADGKAPSAEPREFEAGARKLLTLRGSELQTAIVGQRIQMRLPVTVQQPTETPMGDVYAVRTQKGEEVSAYSNRVGLVPVPPPEAPTAIGAEATAEGIVVTWTYDGSAESFQVFRRAATERGYQGPIQTVPGGERRFVDASAKFGERYIYTVRTVGSLEPLILSEPAGEREVDFEDRFPPPLPGNIVALPERGIVRLRWEPSEADDVAGYRIFRSDPTRREWTPLQREPLDALEYLDRGLAAGLRFEYRIQVIDHAGNESPLSAPVAATPR